MTVFIKATIVFFALGFAVWIYQDIGNSIPGSVSWDNALFGLSGISLVIYLLTLVGALLYKQFIDFNKKGRCSRCGKRVKKGDLYCEFHKAEVQAEYLSKRRGDS